MVSRTLLKDRKRVCFSTSRSVEVHRNFNCTLCEESLLLCVTINWGFLEGREEFLLWKLDPCKDDAYFFQDSIMTWNASVANRTVLLMSSLEFLWWVQRLSWNREHHFTVDFRQFRSPSQCGLMSAKICVCILHGCDKLKERSSYFMLKIELIVWDYRAVMLKSLRGNLLMIAQGTYGRRKDEELGNIILLVTKDEYWHKKSRFVLQCTAQG